MLRVALSEVVFRAVPQKQKEGAQRWLAEGCASLVSECGIGMPNGTDRYEVAVVGAGQAGLAMGYFLRGQGREFVILERADHVAPQWRGRWDSLKLFTPRGYDSLPGLQFPGEPDGYPSRDEAVAYLDSYAETFDLPIRFSSDVRALRREGDVFAIQTSSGDVFADQVVIATGPFQQPRVPAFAEALSDDVVQFHSTRYRSPSDLPAGRTLVVGGGNTGYQIAEDLTRSREVHLAVGGRQAPLPQRFFGRDLFWWLTKTGLIEKTVETKVGQRLKERDALVGSNSRKAKRQGISLHPRVTGASGRAVAFSDGSDIEVDGVVWATGFASDYSWIDPRVTDDGGRVIHRRGVTDVPGLYMLGMLWQYTRGSALLGWVKDDAQFIAQRIAEHAGSASRQGATNGTSPAVTQPSTAGQGDRDATRRSRNF
jgi:putative flavoprotein involved in K+ transport